MRRSLPRDVLLATLWRAGEAIDEIARAMSSTPAYVYRRRQMLALPSRYGAQPTPAESVARMRGVPVDVIAAALGITDAAVLDHLRASLVRA